MVIANGGPLGAGDAFLQVGDGGRLATFNTVLSGVLDPEVTAIQVDLLRPVSEPDLDIRLVLFGPGTSNRWTSTTAAVVEGNGEWDTYTFSLLESDLTQVLGNDSYTDLVGNLNRIMFRHDPGTPSATGTAVAGTLGLDNITAVPEPASAIMLVLFGSGIVLSRRRG